MKIIEKLQLKNQDIYGHRPPTIVFLGDSVTQGCFEVFRKDEGIDTVFEPMAGYVEKVRELLLQLFPAASPAIINAGRSGGSANAALGRLERDVLSYQPDMVVICFGLNDATRGREALGTYTAALTELFEKIAATGAEIIFMTPNLRCTEIDDSITDGVVLRAAEGICESEKRGDLALYLDAARTICGEKQIPVCDCTRIWESFRDGGVDINRLLSNKINHPTREMHAFFAQELIKTMFS